MTSTLHLVKDNGSILGHDISGCDITAANTVDNHCGVEKA
jgi:hypothetical protein